MFVPMKNNKFSQTEGDRVKIPMRFAMLMGRDKSHLVRVNQGNRNLSIESAATTVDLFLADGQPVTIFDVLPSLKKFKRYFCQGCEAAKENP
jgi:hypothetical protein